ncbi:MULTISPECIES: TAXI family TRAP transporter solute-binding subunit [unclassified Streptomyces]|uniref:TAXI family TRAP transporter solute-binding subunit n=1 Tax=unclassified Streptomyces TaxID=2593676 RepID=UPI002ED1DD31|nr:TAXI family TRAP transporter solute-binding subunit [Streptomyces sp. NBC_00891]WSY08173.1 TAXI family TRAP transporter solute-binding subunit [Streptomyces sp. NBC_00890]WSZ09797.1 TAXI family TRAP transporter solute-binding subunit [Streptomyces sp. NBC_00869]WSZ22702.1 TAXI family TRAP transporter solute-binding subunit [Streptomyces sp. NBC_00870]
MLTALSRIGRRHALRAGAALAVVLGMLLWWLLPLGDPAPKGSLSFSTGVRSGVYQRYGERLKGALATDLPHVSIKLQTSEGSQQNLARVAAGEADFTIATTDAVATYLRDRKPGYQRLRGCVRLYDDYIQLIVKRDSDIRSVADLRGRRVAVGQPGSGVKLVADRLMTAAGLDPVHDVTPLPVGIDTMPRLLEEGKLDAFFWSGGLPTTAVADLSERFSIRLVPLEETLIKQLQSAGDSTRYYRSAVMPADAYRNAQQGQAVPTVAVANVLVTTDRTDAAMTEAFTRTVIDSRDRIGREVHAAQLVDLRTAIYTDPLPLHEGAKRYYRSVKP